MGLFNRIRPDPGFVSPVRSDPGFVSPIRSDPIRSDPGFVNGPIQARFDEVCSRLSDSRDGTKNVKIRHAQAPAPVRFSHSFSQFALSPRTRFLNSRFPHTISEPGTG